MPYISLKQIMYNNFLRFPHSTSTTFFQKDKLHPNARGHVSRDACSSWRYIDILPTLASPRRFAHILSGN